MATTPKSTSGITGVSKTSLWNAWKEVRASLHTASVRDVIDFVDFDIDPDVWIRRTLQHLAVGSYEPATPRRFLLAKSKGFSRQMTLPSIPDLVLYRAVVDAIYKRAKTREHKHVYFEQRALSKAAKAAQDEARQDLTFETATYGRTSRSRFLAWLRYDEYRRLLLLKRVYPFIVLTDITNCFDSILYSRIADAVAGAANARLIGLLFFLLERLSIREPFTESPRVGLPVDEFDCSRRIAHMVLLVHDARMVAAVGEEAYIRWMDDQTFGASSKADGLRILSAVGRSLARLHLTANAGKSQILSVAQAKLHFHFRANSQLNLIDDELAPGRRVSQVGARRLRTQLRRCWREALTHEHSGEWEKILKRVYRIAGALRARFLRRRALADLMTYPRQATRIAGYIRATGSAAEYLRFLEAVESHPENVYPDVSHAFVEGLLRIEAAPREAVEIRKLAVMLLNSATKSEFAERCTVAPLLLLRFGDGRSLRRLRTLLQQKGDYVPPLVTRSSAFVLAASSSSGFKAVRSIASKSLRRELAEVVRVLERIADLSTIPDRFKPRLKPKYDAVVRRPYVDMRGIVLGMTIRHNSKPGTRAWIRQQVELLQSAPETTAFDKAIVRRLLSPRP